MLHFKSKYFIKPNILYWAIGIVVFANVFILEYIPQELRDSVKIILTGIYIIFFIWVIFYLSFNTYDKWDLKYKIEDLEEEREKALRYLSNFNKEELLLKYKILLSKISHKTPFIHIFKSKKELTNNSNTLNYILILLVFYISQFYFDVLHPYGPIIFMIMVLLSLIYCFRILFWEVLERKNIISEIVFGHAFVIYLLLSWGKSSYSRTYGDEVLGSFFEKSEYKTKYYINIFTDEDGGKNYRLPADIHVFSETEDGEPFEDRYGQEYSNTYIEKYVILKRVLWPNGGYLYFEDCQLKLGDKVLCSDQDGRDWFIELTNIKVR